MNVEPVLAPNPGPYTLDGTRSYVIDGCVVVDPGPSITSHVEAIASLLTEDALVVLTHRHGDHTPAAEDLRRRTGAAIFGPSGVGVALDRTLVDGDVIEHRGVILRVVSTPGHTSEHVCYLGSGGELFSGDTVLGSGTTVILPPDGDMGEYVASLEKLRALRPKVIYPGHGPVREDAVALITAYIEHRRLRESQILDALRAGALNEGRIRSSIYPDLDERLHDAASSQIVAHLVHMEQRGLVLRSAEGWEARNGTT